MIAESVKYMLYKYEFDPQHPHENLGVLEIYPGWLRQVDLWGSLGNQTRIMNEFQAIVSKTK